MATIAVPLLKFVGTISLGLLTGVSYTTATQSIPSLFSLPSASAANTTFQTCQQSTQFHLACFSAVSSSSLVLSYVLSSREIGRHPYLLWTTLVLFIGSGADYFLDRRDTARAAKEHGAAKNEADDFVDINGSMTINGEGIRAAMENYRVRKIIQTAISGLAFTLATIGIWGEGAGLRARARV